MPNYCVCAGCRNSSLSGHRVHSFPDRTKNSDCFNAWLSFVQERRRDFTAASVTRNAVVCSAHFRKEDYVPGDVMALRMGCRTQNRVRLIPVAVPSIHAADPGSAAGGSNRSGAVRGSIRRKRKQYTKVLGATASDGGTETPGPSQPPPVLHCGSQRSLRPFHLSTGEASMDHDSPDFVPSVFTCTKTCPKKKPKRFCGRRRRRRHKFNVVKEEIKTPPQVDSPVDLQSSVLMKSESELSEETKMPSTPSKETVTKEAEAETGIGTIKSQTTFRPNKTSQSFKVPAGLPGLDKMSPVVLLKPLVIPAGEYQYELCNQDFQTASEPVKRKQLHEEESSFICEICGKHFTSENVFTEHQCDLKDEPSFPCNMCDRSFTSSHNLKRHKLLHVKDGRKCSICGVLFCRRHNHVLFLPKTESATESEEDASVDDEHDASVDELQNVKSEQSQAKDLGDAAQSTGTATSTTTLSTPQKSVLSSRIRKLPPLRPKPPSMLHSPPPVPRYSENPGTSSMPPLPGYPAIFIEPIDLPPPELPPSLKLFSPQYLTSALLEVKRNYEYILSKPCNVKKVIVKEEEYEVPLVSPDEQNVEQVKKERTAYDLEIVV